MPKIFISYRREDTAYPAQSIYNGLIDRFGKESVVFDIDTIPLGVDFRDYLSEEVGKCDVLLAIIGNQWLDILNQRLNEPNDFVRIEIEAALERQIPVVPVLVERASVPNENDLPRELGGLVYRNAAEVRAGHDYEAHLNRLIKGLDNLLTGQPSPKDSPQAEEKSAESLPPESVEEVKVHSFETTVEPQYGGISPAETDKSRKGRKIPILISAAAALLVCLAAVVWFYIDRSEEDRFGKKLEKSIGRDVENQLITARQESHKEVKKSEPGDLPATITNSIGMKFELIPDGGFTMGSPESEVGRGSNETQHPVTISRTFYMQTTEVTQGQWQTVMEDNPSYFKDCGDDCPVERVSWEDAQDFIAKLNAKEGVTHYRLPTEAEWEYAARAGTTTVFSFGDDENDLGDYAWYGNNSNGRTHTVGTKYPNTWNLYDIHGNVWEWVADWYGGDYPNGSVVDPKGRQLGTSRVLRGGGWSSDAQNCRTADRIFNGPEYLSKGVGFRLAKSITLKLKTIDKEGDHKPVNRKGGIMTKHQPYTVPGWVELYDLSVHKDMEAVPPKGYYVRGDVDGESAFNPTSGILGEAIHEAPESTVPGWVELITLTTHRDMEAVEPIEPYVHGVFDDDGHFYPDEPPTVQGVAVAE